MINAKRVVIGIWIVIWTVVLFHCVNVVFWYQKHTEWWINSGIMNLIRFAETWALICLIMLNWLMIKLVGE